jgi:hypothetical protein
MNNDFSDYKITIDKRSLAYETLDRLVKTLTISLSPQEKRQQIKKILDLFEEHGIGATRAVTILKELSNILCKGEDNNE